MGVSALTSTEHLSRGPDDLSVGAGTHHLADQILFSCDTLTNSYQQLLDHFRLSANCVLTQGVCTCLVYCTEFLRDLPSPLTPTQNLYFLLIISQLVLPVLLQVLVLWSALSQLGVSPFCLHTACFSSICVLHVRDMIFHISCSNLARESYVCVQLHPTFSSAVPLTSVFSDSRWVYNGRGLEEFGIEYLVDY